MQSIDIALLSCNRSRLTKMCIEEIAARTSTPYRLIVLDNGSIDDTPGMLRELRRHGVIDSLVLEDENRGVHWGFNTLLGMVRSTLYVCTDGDLIPESRCGGEDWLSRLIRLSDGNPAYGAIACRPHVLIGEPEDRFAGSPEVREMSHAGAHLRLMVTEFVRRAGGWKDTVEPSRDNEDWHIASQLKRIGYKVGYARDVRCLHLFGDEQFGEDPWGYPQGVEHGHREVWPPVNTYAWDRLGFDWRTCRKAERCTR